MSPRASLPLSLLLLTLGVPAFAADGNRLTHLDDNNPYHVGLTSARLITPQWVGEEGVEAVVILAIDDMRGHEKWEAFLRPVLRRLQRIDGRAPVSIMTCRIDPRDAHLQKWLKEGLSLETHTFDHPCPLLGGSLAKAKATYDRCVDLMAQVPNSHPVAFRMPCCDSLNTLSPRFFAEIFNKTTPKGNFLSLDTSVFNVLTSDDPELPRALTQDADGSERFRKYLPTDRAFGNLIENHPYPYVIGRLCWELPCITPSDWQAQHVYGSGNALLLRDWKAALDAVVRKKGVMPLVFHPYGWSRSGQVADLVEYADRTYGKKVKFLTLREVQQRLDRNVLGGHSLRSADGSDNGVRLLDVNNDGFLDAVIGNDRVNLTRLWSPQQRKWIAREFPVPLVLKGKDTGAQFGVLRPDGQASVLVHDGYIAAGYHFTDGNWVRDPSLLRGLAQGPKAFRTSRDGRDLGVRLRDLDGDGHCELISDAGVFAWTPGKGWTKLPFTLPAGTAIVDEQGRDNGLRFVDVDEDGHDDVLFSNEKGYALHLFDTMRTGWSRRALAGKRGDPGALPMIARQGTDNGAWFLGRSLWVQNENTALLKDLVEQCSFNDMLKGVDAGPKSPEASRRCLRARPGFVVELVASEPLVQDPIAFAWGPDGKLWVVEMGDYPLGVDGKGKPGGRVKYLEDTDGDGRYDKATLFLDGLPFPTGVMPWRKGVLVTCAPEIFYAEDTDGDGKADRRISLYKGFREGNQQHRVNGLTWGLDNWIYGANGDSGGRIRSMKTGKTIDIGGRDFRIRPDDGGLDAQTGQSQYGRCRDDWGSWFGCNNSNPLYQFVLADHYLRRNPHFARPELRLQVPAVPGAAPVFPISRTLPRFNDPGAANRFTSANSPVIYRDDLFGPEFADNFFVSEPVHNLVHRERMSAQGVTFRSVRVPDEQRSEFLASSDNWCRPTMLRVGPDGALWVADMYRAVIEHPEWIPRDWQKRLDLRAGHDRGRIYRIYPAGKKPRAVPRLDRLDSSGLVAALDSPSGWQRDLAQQMLLWRAEKAVVPLLEKLLTQSKRPQARLQALCTLDGLDALDARRLVEALGDDHPGVRRNAVHLCEGRVQRSAALADALLRRVTDTDAAVRLQLACSLGAWDDARAGRALGRLAAAAGDDRYQLAATYSSITARNLDAVLRAALEGGASAGHRRLIDELLRMAGDFGNPRPTITLLDMVATAHEGRFASWQMASLAGLLDSLEQKGSSLAQMHKDADEEMRPVLKRLDRLFAAARTLAANPKAEMTERVQAIRLLGRGLDHQGEDVALLADLLVPQNAQEVQGAAVDALGHLPEKRVPQLLLAGWKGYGPGLRARVLDALLRRSDGVKAILAGIESKRVPASEVDPIRKLRLLQNRDEELRARAERVFAGSVSADRQKVIDAYRSVGALKGDPVRGTALFAKNCASCHRLKGVGNEVGPDLAALADRPTDYLLTAILDPNRAVEARYVNYVAETRTGQQLAGVLASETGNSITLLGADGKPQVILRKNLEALSSTGKSAMPEGLEKELKPQDLADVIAHLRSSRPPRKPKSFAGSTPALVRPGADGSLLLGAGSCEIYGPTLVLEKQYGNLGYWSSAEDEAVWTAEVPRAGRYAVWLEWACDPSAAGNAFALEAGDGRLTGKVASTGSWDTYRKARVGTIVLPEGRQHITLRPEGKVQGALIDLKTIRLVPVKDR